MILEQYDNSMTFPESPSPMTAKRHEPPAAHKSWLSTRLGHDAECQYLIQIDFKLDSLLADIQNVNKQPFRVILGWQPNDS
jgi:hypothetical protein